MNSLTLLGGDMLENAKEGGKRQVTDLATPQLDHAPQVERLKEKAIKLVSQDVSNLEKPIFPLIGDMFIQLGKAIFQAMPGRRTFLAAGKAALPFSLIRQGALQEER